MSQQPERYYVEYTTDALWRAALKRAGGVADAVDLSDTYAIKDFATEQVARRWAQQRKYTAYVSERVGIHDRRETEGLDYPVPMWDWETERVAEYDGGEAMELRN